MKTPLIILLLISSSAIGQEPWYKLTKADYWVIGTQALAGASDGLHESLIHHRFGVGNSFLDPKISWQRKYRDWPTDTRSAYPFSKNLLVFTTDAYHLTRTVNRLSTLATIGITAGEFSSWPKKDRWKYVAKKLVLSVLADRLFFNAVYLTTNNSK